jgi:glycogen synthase
MKLLVLTGLYPPYYKGGHEISTQFVADGLMKRGHDLTVLTSKYGTQGGEIEEPGVFRQLRHLQSFTSDGVRKRCDQGINAFKARLNYCLTRKFLAKCRVDLVFAGQLGNISVLTLKAVQDERVPVVHQVGHLDLPELQAAYRGEKNPLKKWYRRAYTGFDGIENLDLRHVIAVSGAIKNAYVEAGVERGCIEIIPPIGISPEYLIHQHVRRTFPQGAKLRLLYVGRVKAEKGVHVAIESVAQLKRMKPDLDIRLDLIGDGDAEYINYLKIRAADVVREAGVITFKGNMNRSELLRQYRNYDILLVPSIWQEPFGIIILEAMSQGIPVVASSVGGIPEIIRHRESGMLVPPNDAEKMAEAIRDLCETPHMLNKIIDNAIKVIEERYAEVKILDRIENYLLKVLRENHQDGHHSKASRIHTDAGL